MEEDLPASDILHGLGLALVVFLAAAGVGAGTGAALFGSRDAEVTALIAKDCEAAKERANQYASALVHLLNRRTVTIGGDTEVRCNVKHKEQS